MVVTIGHGNCIEYTGISYVQLLMLSGSLPHPRYLTSVESFITWNNGIIDVSIKSRFINFFCLRIYWENKIRTLENRILSLSIKGEGYGLTILERQVRNCIKFNIKFISTFAYGDPSIKEKVNGFIRLGDYGFLMDPLYQSDFLDLIKRLGRSEKYLHELLCTSEGRLIWERYGSCWHGTFDTSKDSLSMQLLNKKVKEKSSQIGLNPYLMDI
jgi:hypothetical protein